MKGYIGSKKVEPAGLKKGTATQIFFHAKTKQRRARNRLTKLKNPRGGWAEKEDEIEMVAAEYFKLLFTTLNTGNFDETLRFITEKVTPDMNESLTRPPSDDEIKKALFDINPEKAPGPDGMTNLFYQKFWGITAGKIFHTVRDFFASDTLDPRLN